MLYLFYGVTILYSFLRKKPNKYLWIWIATLLCLLSVTSETYADLSGYTRVFELANSGQSIFLIQDWPVLWLAICKLFGMCGFNYRGMILFILVISTYLFHRFVRTESRNENLFWAMFLLFPALVNIVQLRFYLGTAIAIQSIKILFNEDRLWMLKYFLIVVLATMIHSSCIIFIIFIAAKYFANKKKIWIITGSIFGVFISTLLTNYLPAIASVFIDTARMNRYFYQGSESMTNLGMTKVAILWIAGILMMLYCISFNPKRYKFCSSSEELYDRTALFIMCLCGVCFPLMTFDANFFRIIEFGYLICYVSISNCWKNSFNRIAAINKKYIVTKEAITLLITCIVILSFGTSVYAPMETVIEPLFKYDRFVNILK